MSLRLLTTCLMGLLLLSVFPQITNAETTPMSTTITLYFWQQIIGDQNIKFDGSKIDIEQRSSHGVDFLFTVYITNNGPPILNIEAEYNISCDPYYVINTNNYTRVSFSINKGWITKWKPGFTIRPHVKGIVNVTFSYLGRYEENGTVKTYLAPSQVVVLNFIPERKPDVWGMGEVLSVVGVIVAGFKYVILKRIHV
jgi:hypothetical protein